MSTQRKNLLEAVLNGAWGTIGPKSIASAELIAKRLNVNHGLLLHSASAALEAQLRALEIGYGDEVIVASYGDPIDSMTVAAVGATPVFADIDPDFVVLSPESVKKAMTSKTKAVITDIPGGNPCDAKKLADLCGESGAKLIINLGDGYDSLYDGLFLTHYAWGTVLNLSDGCAVSAGAGGAVVNNDKDAYCACFAYHNCGRAPGDGSTLVMDDILGGNMRITEWQAAMVEAGISELDDVLAKRKNNAKKISQALSSCGWLTPVPVIDKGVSSPGALIFRYGKDKNNNLPVDTAVGELRGQGYDARRPWKAMHRQPAFASPYFQKITGRTGKYGDAGLDNSIAAEEELIWILL